LCIWSVFEKEHIASEAECLHFQAKELGGTYRIEYVRIISLEVDIGIRSGAFGLRHYLTSQQFVGLIPDGVIRDFHRLSF
jgi:hypothetical protein